MTKTKTYISNHTSENVKVNFKGDNTINDLLRHSS